jgi:hypothetical protein
MELCTEGSLYSILDDPVNAYGLCEKDFFLVLYDVGMYYIKYHVCVCVCVYVLCVCVCAARACTRVRV